MMSNFCAHLRLPCHHAGLWNCFPPLSVCSCSWHLYQHPTRSLRHLPPANQMPIQFLPHNRNFSKSAVHQQVYPVSRNARRLTLNIAGASPILRTSPLFSLCSYIISRRTVSQYVKGMRYLENLKENDELCDKAMESGQFTVFYDLRALVSMDSSGRVKLVWRGGDEMKEVLSMSGGVNFNDAVLLNLSSQNPEEPAKFALNIPKISDEMQQTLEKSLNAKALGIRRALFSMSRFDTPDFIQAYSLLQWHSLQAFCSKCGSRNKKNLAGNRRICTNCSETHYPTMKPVIVTLVVDEDKCLVARQRQFPDGMYSALAGFCDMGETMEDTVRREVAEEVGLEVESILYHSSQHWPIPTSGLMMGCQATVKPGTDTQVNIDKNELEDAKWLTREEAQRTLEGNSRGSFWFPPKPALAHQLIRGWAFAK